MLRPHPCQEFLTQFLAKRKFGQPTGKPLYSYKTSQAEYESLKALIKQASSADRTDSLSACFVLFAAEWWRRNYSGGSWDWAGIFRSIDRTIWDTPNIRQPLTSAGLGYWKRPVFQRANGDRAYLGSIFNEAGLPVGLLLNPSSQIRELVVRTFEKQQVYQSEDGLGLVREIAQGLNLPDTFRTDAFYGLIEQVASGLLSLKKEYKLAQQPDPLAFLQQHAPNWQERLPLWLGHDAKAGTFLGELLVETARIPRREPMKIDVTYRLILAGDDWSVRATLRIPDGRHQADALSLTQDEFAQLPDKVAVKIVTANTERRLDYAFKNGNELSVRGLKSVDLPASVCMEAWQLVFANTYNEPIAAVQLPYSDGLPTDVPWVFVQNEAGDWVLRGTGSVRLRAGQARVVCSGNHHWQDPDKVRTNVIGSLPNELVIYEINESASLHDPLDDQTYKIRLTESTEEPNDYLLLPQPGTSQFLYFPRLHQHIYFGFPRLFRVHMLSGSRSSVSQHRIECKIDSTWEPLLQTEVRYGRYKIRAVDAEGDVVYSKEIAVLPANFAIHIDQKNPAVVLRQSGAFTVSVYIGEANLSTQISCEGNGHRIVLLRDNERDRIRLRLTASTCQGIDLYVPFPAANGYFTGKAGTLIPNDSRLSIREIPGNGLIINNIESREKTHDILFRLEGCHKPPALAEIRRQVQLKPFSAELIPLIRFQDDIRRLLSFADSVDAKVRVSVPTFPVSPRLWITQHTSDTAYDQSTRTVILKSTLPLGQTLDIQAFRLDEPFDAAKTIQLELEVNGWIFPESYEGKWFYFAASNSDVQIRPKVAVLKTCDVEEREAVTAMHEASNLSWQNRQNVLHKLFDSIACDFNHADWIALDGMYEITKHLSLQALDAWKALTLSDGGLVCFFLRSNADRLERFTDEFLINWYRIPVTVWQQGVAAYKQYLNGLGLSEPIIVSIIESKLIELTKSLRFESLAQILRVSILNQVASAEFSFVGNFPSFVQKTLTDSVMGQQGNPGLINRHHSYKYPTDLTEEIRSCLQQLPMQVQHLLPDLKAQPYTRSLVYLPAVLAYYSVCPDRMDSKALPLHLVTKLIDFDTEHFYYSFNLIQSFCWQTLAQ